MSQEKKGFFKKLHGLVGKPKHVLKDANEMPNDASLDNQNVPLSQDNSLSSNNPNLSSIPLMESPVSTNSFQDVPVMESSPVSTNSFQDVPVMESPVSNSSFQDVPVMESSPVSTNSFQDVPVMDRPVSTNSFQDVPVMESSVSTNSFQDIPVIDDSDSDMVLGQAITDNDVDDVEELVLDKPIVETNESNTQVIDSNVPTIQSSTVISNTASSRVPASVVLSKEEISADTSQEPLYSGESFFDNQNVTLPGKETSSNNIRYNTVTGEEIDVNELKDEVNGVERLKKVEVEYKPTSTFNTVLLVLFFFFLLGFIIFLPDIAALVDAYKAGKSKVVLEEIPTGKLVCTLETNTVNLDRTIERVFYYEDLKLKSAKFSTIVRGDATLDEESLNELYLQCKQVKENVDGLEGINVSCELMSDKLVENESFDYSKYDSRAVSNAYSEAGGSVLEFEIGQEIDKVMSNMRQGGFKCNKEK